jgi:hypothetical protein
MRNQRIQCHNRLSLVTGLGSPSFLNIIGVPACIIFNLILWRNREHYCAIRSRYKVCIMHCCDMALNDSIFRPGFHESTQYVCQFPFSVAFVRRNDLSFCSMLFPRTFSTQVILSHSKSIAHPGTAVSFTFFCNLNLIIDSCRISAWQSILFRSFEPRWGLVGLPHLYMDEDTTALREPRNEFLVGPLQITRYIHPIFGMCRSISCQEAFLVGGTISSGHVSDGSHICENGLVFKLQTPGLHLA